MTVQRTETCGLFVEVCLGAMLPQLPAVPGLSRSALSLLLLTTLSFDALAEDEQALFNGRDLSGWHVVVKDQGKVDRQDLFGVSENMIHVYPNQRDGSGQPFAGLVTDEEYGDYVLTLEYRWGEAKFAPRALDVRDAGVLFHVHGPTEIWPNSIECQIQEGDSGDAWIIGSRATSTVQPIIRNYAPAPVGKSETRGGVSPRFARFHRSYCWEVPGWNHLEISVRGDSAVYRVNGRVVNALMGLERWDESSGTWQPLRRGRILLQAEGAEVFYRNVRLRTLTP
jgi:hypothetical protein